MNKKIILVFLLCLFLSSCILNTNEISVNFQNIENFTPSEEVSNTEKESDIAESQEELQKTETLPSTEQVSNTKAMPFEVPIENHCIGIDLVDLEDGVLDLIVTNETKNEITFNRDVEITVQYYSENKNSWVETENLVKNIVSNEHQIEKIDVGVSEYYFPITYFFIVKPITYSELPINQKYRVILTYGTVIDGCDENELVASYEFTYQELNDFYEKTLKFKTDEDIKSAIDILKNGTNRQKQETIEAFEKKLNQDFTKTPYFLDKPLGETNWNTAKDFLLPISSSATVSEIVMDNGITVLKNKKDLTSDLVLSNYNNYFIEISMGDKLYFGIHAIWLIVDENNITEIAIEQDGAQLSDFWNDVTRLPIPEGANSGAVSYFYEEKQKRFVIQDISPGYSIQFSMQVSSDSRSCGNREPMILFIYNPSLKSDSTITKILHDEKNLEKVQKFSIYNVCGIFGD